MAAGRLGGGWLTPRADENADPHLGGAMSSHTERTRRTGRLLIVGAACALAGFAAGALAVESKPMIVTPIEDAWQSGRGVEAA
jgi:hypothetical protein